MGFLGQRPGRSGRPVLELLGAPVGQAGGWHRLEWLPLGACSRAELEAAGWIRAWHGCKFEALYSIMFHGCLLESRDPARGERLLDGAPGVYVHKDGTGHKAEN